MYFALGIAVPFSAALGGIFGKAGILGYGATATQSRELPLLQASSRTKQPAPALRGESASRSDPREAYTELPHTRRQLRLPKGAVSPEALASWAICGPAGQVSAT
ncbi:hypothetical protein GCM10011583_64490 [Streptomyces camponoticapitis]|uniref:Uncharacterized protein n=1 Tax=Streptomyces camponoticapitis TaxID=1616125 RepID=A0ABQ2ES38_9ACTN|nr:hypothetical protein GCM10011583_64490 [Streptomyces camponoticapitis]